MVNTFLTHPDFTISAQSLDRQRLGKQRVEAYQILTIIQDLRRLSRLFRIDITTFPTVRLFIKAVTDTYKQSGLHCYVMGRLLVYCPVGFVVTGARLIKLGFVYHPAVRMWYGYDIALKAYINAHIHEWIRRGYNNTMQTYIVPDDITNMVPSWTVNPKIHQNHRSALVFKERSRNEPAWYTLMPEFVEAGPFGDYIWPIE